MMAVGLFEGQLIIYIWDPTGFYNFAKRKHVVLSRDSLCLRVDS